MRLGECLRVAIDLVGGVIMPGEVGMLAGCGCRGPSGGGAGVGA